MKNCFIALMIVSTINSLYNDRNYYNWIITKEFSSQVKQAVKSLLKDYANKMDKDNR